MWSPQLRFVLELGCDKKRSAYCWYVM
jgi:hypothetical protein